MRLDIEAVSAWHRYRAGRAVVLDDVSLTVPAGELAAVLGPSGSGKSTLLRVVAGLHRDAVGQVLLGDRSLGALPPERRDVGLVPQDGALFPRLTVAENIDFGLRRKDRRGRRTHEMLDLFGLGALAGRYPHQLSGGQAQRVAVARALAPSPRLLLLDEPFSALDASLRTAVREAVRTALIETGTTTLLVTHDQGEALSMGSRLIVLADGRVRQAGHPHDVYAAPADLWVGRFLGDANVVDGVSDGTSVASSLGRLTHRPAAPGAVTALVRPEQVVLGGADGRSGVVRSARYFGHDTLLEVVLDDGGTVLVRLQAATPSSGARTTVAVRGDVCVFPRAAP